MSSRPQPNQTDRAISHALVGIAGGAVGATKHGLPGFIVGAAVTAVAHAALDAPLANAVAEVTH
jgi:hypothetical protein